MTGVAIAGVGTGTLIVPFIASGLISAYGWCFSFSVLGIILLLIIAGIGQFFIRDPSQKGLLPYGADGPVVAGAIFDIYGEYEIVWITCIGVSMAACLGCLSIRKTRQDGWRACNG